MEGYVIDSNVEVATQVAAGYLLTIGIAAIAIVIGIAFIGTLVKVIYDCAVAYKEEKMLHIESNSTGDNE